MMRTGQQGILVQSSETGIRFGIDLFLTRIPERKLQILEYVNIKYPGQAVRVLKPGETYMLSE